ncbi:helix-turn-helix domain-containing protein [Brachybacterium paraconglomeratum]|uniref:helix-turn-helix domain-containing protein n=1 Tax=Brachybacterium paraconglomeratum TaxID=173362 RepID=UPI003FD40348
MARKSTKAAEARERARERANRFLEREQELLRIAERFEEAQLEVEGVDAATEVKIAKIREQAEVKIAETRAQADVDASDARERAEQLQREMLELGIDRREVAERLGIPTRQVVKKERKMRKMTEEQATKYAENLAAKGGSFTLASDPSTEYFVAAGSESEGPVVWCNVWVGGEERPGDAVAVDLSGAEVE